MLVDFLLLAFGFILLIRGADYFVEGASALAARLCIPPIVIGLTVVAMGTSAPEAAVSIVSALQGSNGIALGNVIGSNIANILLILGVTSVISSLTVQKTTVRYELPFMGAITLLLCIMGAHYGMVTRGCAFVLLGLFVAFLVYLYFFSCDGKCETPEIKPLSRPKIALYVILGIIALIWGSNLTVESASDIARHLGVSQRLIGLTIVALGTSLPELVISIIAARKGQADLAIGNIIGSNIFNILFVLGLAGAILPIAFSPAFLFDCTMALVAVALLMLFVSRDCLLSRSNGMVFLVVYAAYILHLAMA